MNRFPLLLLCSMAIAFSCGAAAAATARTIPITTVPIRIEKAGTYLVTRDLYLPGRGGGTAIFVGGPDITIDFGGHTLATDSQGGSSKGVEIALRNVTIKNGAIRGFGVGIATYGSAGLLQIDHMRILESGTIGVDLSGGFDNRVTHCQILSTGLRDGQFDSQACGIKARGLNTVIRNNFISGGGIGILLAGGNTSLIDDNEIIATTFGIRFEPPYRGIRRNNRVIGAETPYFGGTDGGGNE